MIKEKLFPIIILSLMSVGIQAQTDEKPISGLTGKVSNIKIAVEAPVTITTLSDNLPQNDLDMRRMAQWAMNYLIRSPRKEYNYEPVFQCKVYGCPPIPSGQDPVVPCDTDARLDWEWYYMREVSGSTAGLDVERSFHRRMLDYVQDDGTVLSPPGCYNEGETTRVWKKEEYYYHIWGATKILQSMAEDYRRTGNKQSKETGRKIMLRLKKLAIYTSPGVCYFAAGMGAVLPDGTPVPNGWNSQPAPIVEPLVNYYLATGDQESLAFARAYAEGIMTGAQPDGVRFKADGDFGDGHGHATMHALWGIAHLGVVTGESRYVEFVKRAWDFYLTRGTGAGWFPAVKDHPTDETCLLSDMMSNATMIARGGYPEYFDYVERYMRNIISNRQFIMTPAFEASYRKINAAHSEEEISNGLAILRNFQGACYSFCGLNQCENDLLGGNYYELAGCCAPEGLRAIYTTWLNVIEHLEKSKLGPEGVYVNMCLNRDSKWGRVVSFFPENGRITVRAAVKDLFFLRPPQWAPRSSVHAFVGNKPVPVVWSGSYVRFDKVKPGDELTITYPLISFTHEVSGIWARKPDLRVIYQWLGNMVVSVDPPPTKTPLFLGKPRILPIPDTLIK
ncbi:MAG: hypothetical protein V2A67_05995 [Bacteroidota bacterium]